MPDLNFSNPQGQTLTVNSPDGSVPSEQELDTMFSQKYGSTDGKDKSDILLGQNEETSQESNPDSTGDIGRDIAGDVARGALNSGAGTVDKINGAVKLLKNVSQVDLGSDQLTNVSNQLKQLASQQSQSSNKLVSGIGQFVGSVPDALMEFAGTGGGLGFVAKSAALQAAQEYNKTQSPADLIKGGVEGGTIGLALDKLPNLVEGTAQMIKKWGQTSGKTYLRAVTGATDKEAQEIIDNLPNMDINPKTEVEDYNEAKDKANIEVSTLKDNNKNLIEQQKDQNTKDYLSAKSKSDDAVNTLLENNRDAISDLRDSQSHAREDLSSSTSENMLASADAGTQKLADATAQATTNGANARNALDNTLVSVFDTASKKIDAMTKGVSDDVANAHASLEKNNLSYAQMPIVQYEADSAIARGAGKFFNMKRTPDGKGMFLSPMSGTQTPSVSKAIELINSVRSHLVSDFMKTGKTSLAAIEANSDMLEGAIQKGFNGNSVPQGLAAVMADLKNSINPTKLFNKYPQELSHLKPLADANKSYSAQIDGLRNALNLYKDNVDGAVNPQKVFRALDKNDSAYIAKLRQADEALPKEDRIFGKVKDAYDKYRAIENSEKMTLTQAEKEISRQRVNLASKFKNMKNDLITQQRKELAGKIKQARMTNRVFKKEQGMSIESLQSHQRQALDIMQAQKDKELSVLQESINKRLNSLHLLHMARGARASASGTAKIFQNVANYRSIDGMTTLNPMKMIQGSIISKLASPSGASNTIKWALNAPKELEGIKNATGNVILKKLLAAKLSGR